MDLLVRVGLLVLLASLSEGQTSPWTWTCENKACLRTLKNASFTGMPMDICKLTCDDAASLWPKPTGPFVVGRQLVSVCPVNIVFDSFSDNPQPIQAMLTTASNIFKDYITMLHPPNMPCSVPNNRLRIIVTVTDGTTLLGWNTDESYNLILTLSGGDTVVTAAINAATFFGARHALETLSQLIAYNGDANILQVVGTAGIVDRPIFKYRGVMLDTSRNYFTLDNIKKLIDGMSYNKLNMFHWHITDSYTFPMEVESRPKFLEYGPYSPDKVYLKSDIMDLVSYARQRGVKVIPELDQPAHSGHGYQWGALDGLGDLVVCVESEPWYDFCVQPPCGQLNVINDNVTVVVGDIFKDMMAMFDNDVFHMGGDEVDFRCYNSSEAIRDWMTGNGMSLEEEDFFQLWGDFQAKGKLEEASSASTDVQAMLWTSGLTDPVRIERFLDKAKYVFQIWSEGNDPNIGGILQLGYRAIFSNVDAMYLDCGWPNWLGDGHNWCSPMKGWQTIYDNNPEKLYAAQSDDATAAEAVRSGQILGAETPLWSEQADNNVLQTRVWPRAAAHAERLWTHPSTSFQEAEIRMVTNRQRMQKRGIHGDRLQPEFCLQYEGRCHA